MTALHSARAARPTQPLPPGGRAREGAVNEAHKRHQDGAAVLMALFVASLATIIVSGLFWNQFVLLRTIENQQLVTQSRLLLRGALDWARAILREDQRTTRVDTLAEPWAQGLAETRLDQLGETSALAARATMAGGIEDAQGRFNLRNLVRSDFEIDEFERNSLRKLCSLLQLPEQIADILAQRMRESLRPRSLPAGATASPAAAQDEAPPPIPLLLPQDLLGVAGIDPAHAVELAKHVVILDAVTPVNLNTAGPAVFAARFTRMQLTDALRLVGERDQRGQHFVQVGEARLQQHVVNGEPREGRVSIDSRYFLVSGTVRLERASTRMEALVRRGDSNQAPVRVIWQREL